MPLAEFPDVTDYFRVLRRRGSNWAYCDYTHYNVTIYRLDLSGGETQIKSESQVQCNSTVHQVISLYPQQQNELSTEQNTPKRSNTESVLYILQVSSRDVHIRD